MSRSTRSRLFVVLHNLGQVSRESELVLCIIIDIFQFLEVRLLKMPVVAYTRMNERGTMDCEIQTLYIRRSDYILYRTICCFEVFDEEVPVTASRVCKCISPLNLYI